MNASIQVQPDMDLHTTHARLQKLERSEWFRWGAAMAVSLALTVGLLMLSWPMRPNGIDQEQLDAVRGLFGLILLFDIFVVHQQVLISRLRRQLTAQLNLIIALDMLKPGEAEDQSDGERRAIPRARFEQALRITEVAGAKTDIQGRIRNLTENGLGAVIPAPLQVGEEATLEFTADDCRLTLKAVIRHRQGIQYGFEFTGLSDSNARTLQEVRLRHAPSEAARTAQMVAR